METPRAFVYMFRHHDGRPLYVGMTNNLRKRFNHHRFTKAWIGEVGSTEVIECRSTLHAKILEAAAIIAFEPPYTKRSHQGLEGLIDIAANLG